MNRREFVSLCGLGLLTSLLPFGLNGWAAVPLVAGESSVINQKKLIVIFQRGGIDGLSVVVPFSDSTYYDARPTIAIAPPDSREGVINLDGIFGLHPVLEAVLPLWNYKTLAFINACGPPNSSCSHREAQNVMELGTPDINRTSEGWLNRLLGVLTLSAKGTHGISTGSSAPLILGGKIPAGSLPSATTQSAIRKIDQPVFAKEFDQLYQLDRDLSDVYHEAKTSRQKLFATLEKEGVEADHGAPSPSSFEKNCGNVAKAMARDPTMQVAFLDVGGWDTHINQGAAKGALASHLHHFGRGVSSLVKGLGRTYDDTLIVVVSEFGRTLKENSYSGTDHGHGNILWALGGQIRGGKVYGEWPGLSKDSLHESHSLAVTTDYRQILGEMLQRHFQLNDAQMAVVFPNTPAVTNIQRRSLKGLLRI